MKRWSNQILANIVNVPMDTGKAGGKLTLPAGKSFTTRFALK